MNSSKNYMSHGSLIGKLDLDLVESCNPIEAGNAKTWTI